MQKKFKKLTTCVLVTMMCLLATMPYPVHATEIDQNADTGETHELDENAVSMGDTATAENVTNVQEAENNPESEQNQSKENEIPYGTNNTTDKNEAISGNKIIDDSMDIEKNINIDSQEKRSNEIQLAANNTGDFIVTGGTYGVDYTYNPNEHDGVLYILTNKELTISTNGIGTSAMIRGNTKDMTYNLIFSNLVINSSRNDSQILTAAGTSLNITLLGSNKLGYRGNMISTNNLCITDKSTGSLITYVEAGWGDGLCVYGNLEVNGGILKYNKADIRGSISTSGSGKINPKAPIPTNIKTKTTANTIEVIPLDNTDIYGTAQYKLDNGNWGTNTVFTNLKAQRSYTVYTRYLGNELYLVSDSSSSSVTTSSPTYTITIPQETLTAGNESSKNEISVDTNNFDLGYGGKVDVKVSNNGSISSDGKLILIRQQDTGTTTITSALLVNGTPFTDINNPVATFKATNNSPVSISFEKPVETKILAGTYSGTVTFEVSYSEP